MQGGDEEVIAKGLALAGLVMLKDYQNDREEDAANGKYNPLNSGTWDFDTAWEQLERVSSHPKASRLNAVLSTDTILKVFCNWYF